MVSWASVFHQEHKYRLGYLPHTDLRSTCKMEATGDMVLFSNVFIFISISSVWRLLVDVNGLKKNVSFTAFAKASIFESLLGVMILFNLIILGDYNTASNKNNKKIYFWESNAIIIWLLNDRLLKFPTISPLLSRPPVIHVMIFKI